MSVIMYAGNKNSGEVYDAKIAQLIANNQPLPGQPSNKVAPVNLEKGADCSKKPGQKPDGTYQDRPICRSHMCCGIATMQGYETIEVCDIKENEFYVTAPNAEGKTFKYNFACIENSIRLAVSAVCSLFTIWQMM